MRSTRSSNIISEASSCVHCFPGLRRICRHIARTNSKTNAHNTLGMNRPSQTCDQGPCPRSWHRPASVTQRTSRSVIPRLGCFRRSVSTMFRARWATPSGGRTKTPWSEQNKATRWRTYLYSVRSDCATPLARRRKRHPVA